MDDPDAKSPSRLGSMEKHSDDPGNLHSADSHHTLSTTSSNSISDSARALAMQDIQDVLEDVEGHQENVVAAEHKRIDGWNSLRFKTNVFLEQLLFQMLYPCSIPIIWYLRGAAAVRNLRMLPEKKKRASSKAFFFMMNFSTALSLAAIALWAWLPRSGPGYEAVARMRVPGVRESPNGEEDAAWWRSIDYEMASLMFVMLFHRAILALKYAYLPCDDYQLLMTQDVPKEVLEEDQLLTGWTDVPVSLVRKEVAFSALRLGVDASHIHLHLTREQYKSFLSGLSASALAAMMSYCGGKACMEAAVDKKSDASGGVAHQKRAMEEMQDTLVRFQQDSSSQHQQAVRVGPILEGPPLAAVQPVNGGESRRSSAVGSDVAYSHQQQQSGAQRGEREREGSSPGSTPMDTSDTPAVTSPQIEPVTPGFQAAPQRRSSDGLVPGSRRQSALSPTNSYTSASRGDLRGDHHGHGMTDSQAQQRPITISVDMLCTALFAHANSIAQTCKLSMSKSSMIAGVLLAFLPMIIRAGWGMPVIGRSIPAAFISLVTAVTNAWLVTLLLLYLQTGVLDYQRRRKVLEMLGEIASRRYGDVSSRGLGDLKRGASTRGVLRQRGLNAASVSPATQPTVMSHLGQAPARLERRPSVLTTDAAPTLQPPLLSLDNVGNIRAWLLARRILSGVGLRYFRRVNIIASVSLVFAGIMIAAIMSQLLLSEAGGNSQMVLGSKDGSAGSLAFVGDFIMILVAIIFDGVISYYVMRMLLEGAAANTCRETHGALILGKQVEAEQAFANCESRRDSVISGVDGHHSRSSLRAARAATKWKHAVRMLEVVRDALPYEEPLRVLGFPASYAFAQSLASAALTAESVMIKLLNDKFRFINLPVPSW